MVAALLSALAMSYSVHANLGPVQTGTVAEIGNLLLAKKNKRGRRDHDRARDAVGSGDVLPLGRIMDRVGRRYPGRLLDADLRRDDRGRWLYRLKLLAPGDRVRRLVVDAQTGRVLSGGH
jgi:uncharacterized membrane protein YkoI